MGQKLTILLFLAVVLGAFSAPSFSASSCGDQGLGCSQEEKCCEHTVASFTNDGASMPPYMDGKCVPKGQSCSEFWCGNQHCESGFFGVPTVCCVNNTPGLVVAYQCAHSELSCPGNTQQLTIRPPTITSGLRNNE